MNFDDEDKLELQHLAGGNIITHAPVFSSEGRFLFVRCALKAQVFVCSTGELTRELTGATSPLISLELELKQPEVLVGCTATGELLRWHWRTGVLQRTTRLGLTNNLTTDLTILTCNLIDYYKTGEMACAFVTAKVKSGQKINWFVVNTETGQSININCGLQLKLRTPLVAVGRGEFKYVIIAQGYFVYYLNYATWQFTRYKNAGGVIVTQVAFSPSEELAATGDEKGRIFLWRRFGNQKTMVNTLFHWHHTAVTSIAFTPTGNTFYSSGHEAVLVKWSQLRPNERNYLPRMSSIIRHIVISDGYERVAICTDDNAVQFLDVANNDPKSALQHFTYAVPDKTNQDLFPIGLCLNPRNNTLVLNGRAGHLQFYSAYTRSLLYNLRVVQKNINSYEEDRIIYNTRITCAAFNIHWMATGEVYNDECNFPEVRLKFWAYNEKLQRYELNTNIELPHENGFKAIVFSNQFQVKNLRCATIGQDDVIKLWGIEKSENIYKGGEMWSCLAQTTYKQFPISSVCFSQDGSLLAAGFGNTLCLYDARTLLLLHALSSPAGYDGVVAKAQLRLGKQTINGTRKEFIDQRQKILSMLRTLLTSDDQKLIDEAQQLIAAPSEQLNNGHKQLGENYKSNVYKYIMQMSELGLYQKLQLLRRFGIECQVSDTCKQRLMAHLKQSQTSTKKLATRLQRINTKHRFKAKQRLVEFVKRKRSYDRIYNNELLPLFNALQLDKQIKATPMGKSKLRNDNKNKLIDSSSPTPTPLQSLAEISHVQFGAGTQAHLVAVCTEARVLVWNLMTMRLQAGLKLSVRHLSFDPLTNLLAAVTHNNELHVFQPNVPLPVYQRRNIPDLFGLVWLPRRQPRPRSINVDWQAQSTLHMLTKDQQIVYLGPPGGSDDDSMPPPVAFTQSADDSVQKLRIATFGIYAGDKTQSQLQQSQQSGPLIIGRRKDNVVNALINLSAHTMPAMSLISGEFIKSLLTPAETTTRHNASNKKEDEKETPLSNGIVNGNGLSHHHHHHDDESDDEEKIPETSTNVEKRKKLLALNDIDESKNAIPLALDAKLEKITILNIDLDF